MSIAVETGVEAIHASCLGSIPHGFFGRAGGVSDGAVWGLNAGFGSGDEPQRIEENRRRAAAAVLPDARIVTVHQIHSDKAVRVLKPWSEAERPQADALVTDRPGVLLGILTADCAPVLFSDSDAGVVAAAHAGWRGALAGIVESTIEAMEELGASRDSIAAAVGPCIAQSSYEVDDGFRSAFLEHDPGNSRFFVDGAADRWHFDLQAYVRHRVLASGIGEVEALRLDTYAHPDRFFSYRRSSHSGEPSYGRQISLIGLPPRS